MAKITIRLKTTKRETRIDAEVWEAKKKKWSHAYEVVQIIEPPEVTALKAKQKS